MYITHQAPAQHIGPARLPAARTVRKIALCGSYSASLEDAPWTDPSWEFWGHSSSRNWYRRPMDRFFDLHPPICWSQGGKKGDTYPKWLAKNLTPIYMQKQYPEVPASVMYPKGQVLMEFADARGYFTNHVAWMIALALMEGVSAIGLFGINYSSEGEYLRQRGSCEYWLGRAAGAGVRIVLPEQCTLLREPALLYGYESHEETTGKLRPEYRPKVWNPLDRRIPAALSSVKLADPPSELVPLIAAEEKEFPRPEWALGPLPEKPNGAVKEVNA